MWKALEDVHLCGDLFPLAFALASWTMVIPLVADVLVNPVRDSRNKKNTHPLYSQADINQYSYIFKMNLNQSLGSKQIH